ncbi:MAG: hypothetical protein ACRC6T_08315 [Sarcina sp.]
MSNISVNSISETQFSIKVHISNQTFADIKQIGDITGLRLKFIVNKMINQVVNGVKQHFLDGTEVVFYPTTLRFINPQISDIDSKTKNIKVPLETYDNLKWLSTISNKPIKLILEEMIVRETPLYLRYLQNNMNNEIYSNLF